MGTTTTNLSLYKPSVGEIGWGALVDGNFDTLDTQVFGKVDSADLLTPDNLTLEQQGATLAIKQGAVHASTNAVVTPFTLKGAAAQTADLEKWQDSTGATLSAIRSNGGLRIKGGSYGANEVLNTESGPLILSNAQAGDIAGVPVLQVFDAAGTTETVRITNGGTIRATAFADIANTVNLAFVTSNRVNITGGNLWLNTAGAVLQFLSPDGTKNEAMSLANNGAWTLGTSGSMNLTERAEPSNPGANIGVLFTKDSGAGKTQLCVRFPTGASQVIATEP